MDKKQRKALYWLWLVFPVTVLLCTGAIINKGVIPLVQYGVDEGKKLYWQKVRKNDSRNWPEERKKMEKDSAQLDSLLQHIEKRKSMAGGSLVDELYHYADKTGFTIDKVEAGIPQKVKNYRETTLAIEGKGTYTAIGSLIEKIENNSQATRIRHLTLSRQEKSSAIALFMNVAVCEEAVDE